MSQLGNLCSRTGLIRTESPRSASIFGLSSVILGSICDMYLHVVLSTRLHFLFVQRPRMVLSRRRVKVCFLWSPTRILRFQSSTYSFSFFFFIQSDIFLLSFWKARNHGLHWISENEFVLRNSSYWMRCASVGWEEFWQLLSPILSFNMSYPDSL